MVQNDDTENITYYNDQLSDINANLKELRKELRMCRDIEKRSVQVKENLEIIEQEQAAERQEEKGYAEKTARSNYELT